MFIINGIFLLILIQIGSSEDEHRVHNIILYPERNSWCQTTAIQQVVASPGYESVTIDNTVCVGACYSYSIPKTQPAEPGELIGPYCDSCQPVATKCYHVTLHADAKNVDGPRTFQKRVQIITNCSCTTCGKPQESCEISDQNLLELPSNLFLNNTQEPQHTEDVPELLHFPKNHNHQNSHLPHVILHNKSKHYELNAKLIKLLKSIQETDDGSSDETSTNIQYDKEQLEELLNIIEGSEHELSDKNLMEFVNFVNIHNSEDLEIDLSRLKQVLINYENERNNIGQNNNKKIEDDLKKYNLPSNFGLESTHHYRNREDTPPTTIYHPLHHHHQHHHHHHPHHQNGDVVHDVSSTNNNNNNNNNNPHHHSLGEPVMVGLNLEHLIKGPHGSMVLRPDLKVEEKLDIDSDILKPNHDGVVISYENHDNKNNIDE